jgi:hypothetical protein
MASKKVKTTKGKNHLGNVKASELKRTGKDENLNRISRTNLDKVRMLNKNNLK